MGGTLQSKNVIILGTTTTTSPLSDAFESTKIEFLNNLPDIKKEEFSRHTSIQEGYDATDKIHTAQSQSGTLRNRKIFPYLGCLV